MSKYIITTESNSEIPFEWEDQNDFGVLRMPYTIDDVERFYDLGRETDIPGFFNRMREKTVVTTAQRNPHEIVEYFEPYLKKGYDILHIAFSSKLSGTFNNELIARDELLLKYPERRIEIIDTLAISMPLGIIVGKALEMRNSGHSLDDVKTWVETHKLSACALFVVDNLEYLRRGGRITNFAAFMGTALQLKPIITITPDGFLQPIAKVKGRRKAVKYMIDKCKNTILNPEDQEIYILHADCEDEALKLRDMIMEEIKPKDAILRWVGPVIGSHCGPGTLAVVYFAKHRDELMR